MNFDVMKHMSRYIFALVILLLVTLACNKKKDDNMVRARAHMIVVLDAAHGGTDTGKTANGKMEKSMALALCNKMMQLAPDYNMEVRLTRTEDRYMEPSERQDIANAINADMLISLHINKSGTATPRPYEIFVVAGGPKETESKLLARMILADLKKHGRDTLLTERAVLTLNGCRHTAIAIECGDMGKAEDIGYMEDENGLCRQILASVVAYGNSR